MRKLLAWKLGYGNESRGRNLKTEEQRKKNKTGGIKCNINAVMKAYAPRKAAWMHYIRLNWCINLSREKCESFQIVISAQASKDVMDKVRPFLLRDMLRPKICLKKAYWKTTLEEQYPIFRYQHTQYPILVWRINTNSHKAHASPWHQ